MRVESTSFGSAQLRSFVAEMRRRDRELLLARLRSGRARLLELAGRVADHEGDGEWSAKEVLAHIAVFSKAWGTLGTLVAKGRLQELDVSSVTRQRDLYGERMVVLPVGDIAATAAAEQQRTIDTLAALDPEHLGRSCSTELGHFTAAELLGLLLTAHLEEHLEQLEAALARETEIATAAR